MSFSNYALGSQSISAKNIFTTNENVGTSLICATGCQFVITASTTGVSSMTGGIFYNTSDNKIYVNTNGTQNGWIRTVALS